MIAEWMERVKKIRKEREADFDYQSSCFPKPLTTTDLPMVSSAYQRKETAVPILSTQWTRVCGMSPSRWQIWFILSELDDVFIMPFRPPTLAGGVLLNPSTTDRIYKFRDDPVNVTGEWYARCSLVGGVNLWVVETVPSR